MRRRPPAAPPRKGVILLVVLSLLTLFAIIGISFVLYAGAAADSARIATGAESVSRPDVEAEVAMAYFLQQLLFDVNDDESGIGSALRGHSLSRSMFGYKGNLSGNSYVQATSPAFPNPHNPDANDRPFVGTGRLHFSHPAGTPLAGIDDYVLVNYTYHRADNFLRDPERYGTRPAPRASGAAENRRPWVGGYNAPYTYPDLNNMYLGAMRAGAFPGVPGSEGAILAHSFHRLYTGFGSLDPGNPNWTNTADVTMKYKVLRPRPAEHPNFPLPEDAGGDVKNVIGSPGYYDPITNKFYNNDSFWMDLGAPVMRSADGRLFKMLFAPFIVDLDGRVNLNTHGNIRGRDGGGNPGHASNHGLGLWEVNLGPILDSTGANHGVLSASNGGRPEWVNLFQGLKSGATVTLPGRYGRDQWPTPATAVGAGLFST